jgi:hypothetical protein
MIGFIDPSLYNLSLTYNQHSAIADLLTFRFTTAHAPEFSVSTSRIQATGLGTGAMTSNQYEVFLPFLIPSPWIVYSIQFSNSNSLVSWFLTLYSQSQFSHLISS